MLLDIITNFEITLNGGFAWYFLICTLFVTFYGLVELVLFLIKIFKK